MIKIFPGILTLVLAASTLTTEPVIAPDEEQTAEEAAEEAASSIDFDYSGPIDTYTGAPMETNEDGTPVGESIVSLPDGGSYDRNAHAFIYSVPDTGLSIHSSIANEIVTTGTVSIEADEGLTIELYKQSRPQTDTDLTSISAPGKYTVVAKGQNTDQQLLSFQIVTRNTGSLDRYQMPSGFIVTGVTYNGQKLKEPDTRVVDLSAEGSYEISYRCVVTDVEYELALDIDHTLPTLTLEGVENGVARGPVTLSGFTEEDTLTVTYNKAEYRLDLNAPVLRNVGDYVVTVKDPAGNAVTESFTIRMYLNYQSVIFFLLSIGIIAGAIAFMVISRKRLRVR